MLPLSVLTLALLGGFIFVTQWHPTRYYTLRSEGYRLLFLAAVFGAVFLVLASFLIQVVLPTEIINGIGTLWKRFVLPEELEGLSRAGIAFLLGASLWLPSNLLGRQVNFLSNEAAIDRAIKNKKDPLETFLYHALYNPSRERQVLVSVKNGKVYVGILRELFNPAFPLTSIAMVLTRSGHREASNQQVQLDIDYAETIRRRLLPRLVQIRIEELRRAKPDIGDEALLEEVASEFGRPETNESLRTQTRTELENYQIVIPLTEVQSVTFFDEHVHEEYRQYFASAPATGGTL